MMRNVKIAKERGCKVVNVELPFALHRRASVTASQRGITLRQLFTNGLHLALGDDDVVKIDSRGNVHNDLRGEFAAIKPY
jgi:hypothetical protein